MRPVRLAVLGRYGHEWRSSMSNGLADGYTNMFKAEVDA